MLKAIGSSGDVVITNTCTEKTETLDRHRGIEYFMTIYRRVCYVYMMKCPVEKSTDIPKSNERFDLSFIGFYEMAQFITLFILRWLTNMKMVAIIINNYKNFNEIFSSILEKNAPQKTKLLRANNKSHVSKLLRKAIIKRSRLKN